MKKAVSVVAVVLLVALAASGIFFGIKSGVISQPKTKNDAPVVFSSNRMLLELWTTYKSSILEPTSLRALDKGQGNITTSEGQSYTMMRAVWMDDMKTFDTVWNWTKDNMQRDSDKLISWRFGETGGGNYGIQTEQGGQNTATDADVDIAYSLIMAAARWKDPVYLYDAQDIIKSIWEKEVVAINGKPVLVANDIERLNTKDVLINPSYFAPYAYRAFQKIDPSRNWQGLVDNSYTMLFATADATLDKKKSSGLTPNWARVNRTTGAIQPAVTNDSNYGYDAFRTPWRLALDWKYNKDVRAQQVLSKYSVINSAWTDNKKIDSIYSHDGTSISKDDVPAAYGTNIGYFLVTDQEKADQVYNEKLLPLYNPDTQSWKSSMSYYDDNWAWFGMALYLDQLPNLAVAYER